MVFVTFLYSLNSAFVNDYINWVHIRIGTITFAASRLLQFEFEFKTAILEMTCPNQKLQE